MLCRLYALQVSHWHKNKCKYYTASSLVYIGFFRHILFCSFLVFFFFFFFFFLLQNFLPPFFLLHHHPPKTPATTTPATMDSDATTRFVPEHRRTNFKNRGHFKADELRRRREEAQVEIRKAKREENLTKRRNFDNIANDSEDEDEELTTEMELTQELPVLLEQLRSSDIEQQLQSTIKFRKYLSKEKNPPIEQVVKCNIIPRFVEFLSSAHSVLQFEAAWVLTNIVSGSSDQTKAVIDAGAIPCFVHLLTSNEVDLKEQAVWALGNIAGDSAYCRDLVLKAGALPPLLSLLESAKKVSLLRNATWTLSNFCRGKNPQPDWEIIKHALPTLAKLVYSFDDEILIDACWAVSYLSDGTNEKIQAVIEAGLPRRLVELLNYKTTSVQTPALRSVGNIVTGNDLQTQFVINCGALPALLGLLASPKDSIRKETCWTISNITAGNSDQIQAIIEANLIPPLIHLLATSDYRTKKEACWALSNATSSGLAKPEQVRYLVSQGCIKPLCDILASNDNKIIQVALDALENILKIGENDKIESHSPKNEYAIYIEEAGGMELINDCQANINDAIYQKAYNIIDKYFNAEDEDIADDAALAPQTDGQTFGFGNFN